MQFRWQRFDVGCDRRAGGCDCDLRVTFVQRGVGRNAGRLGRVSAYCRRAQGEQQLQQPQPQQQKFTCMPSRSLVSFYNHALLNLRLHDSLQRCVAIILGKSACWCSLTDPAIALAGVKTHVTFHMSHVTRHSSHFTCHTSHVTFHMSHFTCHSSHVTRHTPHSTRHTSSQSHKPLVELEQPRETGLAIKRYIS